MVSISMAWLTDGNQSWPNIAGSLRDCWRSLSKFYGCMIALNLLRPECRTSRHV